MVAKVVLVLTLLLTAAPVSGDSPVRRWLVYYGDTLPADSLNRIDLAILEPSAITPDRARHPKTTFVGYLSLGEISKTDPRWWEVEAAGVLVDENPVWKGAWRIDIRSPKWRQMVLDRMIPAILNRGYQGIFLDTIDTAAYLEAKDPKKFNGSQRAMTALIREIRKRYAKITILPNNGLELLEEVGGAVDGVVVEDLHTRYDFDKKTSTATPPAEMEAKEAMLDHFARKFRKPVYNIVYETSVGTPLARQAIARSEQKGYLWYVTTVDLMRLGTVMP